MTKTKYRETIFARVREAAGSRCGYCLAPQAYALQVLEIEHIVPTARGGADTEDNLWLACRLCNNAKGVKPMATTRRRTAESASSIQENNDGSAISIGVRTLYAWWGAPHAAALPFRL